MRAGQLLTEAYVGEAKLRELDPRSTEFAQAMTITRTQTDLGHAFATMSIADDLHAIRNMMQRRRENPVSGWGL